MKELRKQNTELEEHLMHSQEDHQENDALRQRLLDLQKQNGRLDSSVKNANDKCRQLEQEKDDLLNRSRSLESENTAMAQQLLQEKAKVTRLENNKNDLRDSITNLKTETKFFTDRYLQCAKDAESAKLENSKLDIRMKELRKRNTKLEERLQHMQEDHKEKDELRQRLLDLQKQNGRLDSRVKDANDRCRHLEQEKDALLTRLSQYTSAQLVHDNPNVADLSDLNRPTKLAEKYSELYDNEWTDAFEVLIEQYSFSEEQAINHLLQIVLTAYTYCSETGKQQVETLKKALVDPFAGSRVMSSLDLDPVQIRLIQDLRKQTSKHSIESVKKGFIHHLKSQLKHPDPSSVSTYVEKCAELCWYMVLPTPPLFISSSDLPDDTFDKNKYRFYQTSGTKYTFIVWPALYLYKDGNILAKGIAEA